MKKYFILATAALAFAACSNDEIVPVEQVQQVVDDGAVRFDVYTQRSVTRAGTAGSISTTSLQTGTHKDAGFGVFAYYTDNTDYTQYAIPNFMYNEQVKYNSTKSVWEYEPVKYWPNEFGSTANSDDVDKVTFFAYAPWIQVTATSGSPTGDKEKNITQITKNTATGDPIIKYVVDTNPTTSVDLLWGVVPAADTYQAVDGTTAAPTLTAGLPYIDLVKAQAANRVKFNFKHALAKLNVQIDAFVDEISNTTDLDSKTRIYVRSITLGGFAVKGALNLNNTTANEPLWLEYDGSKELTESTVTYYDGRKDGKEATANGEQKSEKPATLNNVLIEDENTYSGGTWGGSAKAGVTKTPVNLFEGGSADGYIYVIPTVAQMDVTIVYDVETIDPDLPGYLADGVTHGSSVENKIYKENVFSGNIDPGKAYQLKLHLGMTSVKFDAEVIDWDVAGSEDVDLPHNTRSIYATPAVSAVAAAGANVAITAQLGNGTNVPLSGNTCDGTMQLNDGSAAATIVPAALTGSNFVVPANATVFNKAYTFKLTGVTYDAVNYESNNITITQAPAALGLTDPTIMDGDTNFDLTSTGEVTTTKDWTAAEFTVKVNGTTLTPVTDYTVTSTDETTATIALTSGSFATDDVVAVTVKAGDAAPETKTVTVP